MLMGLSVDEGRPLDPSDSPSTARLRPDRGAYLEEARAKRVELKRAHYEVLISKALLAAEQSARALLGVPLPPITPGDNRSGPAWKSLPVSDPRARLARDIESLKDQESKAERFLNLYSRRLGLNYKQIRSSRAERESFGGLVRARRRAFADGSGTLGDLLEAQRSWTEATSREYQAVVSYNNALAGFDYGKGAILERHKVSMGVAGVNGPGR